MARHDDLRPRAHPVGASERALSAEGGAVTEWINQRSSRFGAKERLDTEYETV